MDAVWQASQEKPREQHKAGIGGERRGTRMAALAQIENEKSGDDGIVYVDETDGQSRNDQRAPDPTTPPGMSRGLVVLGHAAKEGGRRDRGDHLEASRLVKRTEQLADQGPSGDTAPNAAAQITERARAAVDASDFDGPRRCAGVKASFADSLQATSQIEAADSK